jgi:hypothetical protein
MHIVPSTAPRVRGCTRESRAAWIGAGLLALTLAACNNSSTPDQGTLPVGSFATNPNTGLGFIVDPSAAGRAPQLRIVQTFFGRLVRIVASSQGSEVVMHENYVINPTDLGDGIDYEVRTNQITGDQTLVVFRDVSVTEQLLEFRQIVKGLGDQLRVVGDNGFVGAGSYTMVPRNAAIVLQFDDLIDANTVTDQSVKVLVGVPTTLPFEARLLVDQNRGDLADIDGNGELEFYSTRIIVDPTVSEPESFATNPPLPVNTTGLPASVEQLLSNVQVRLATRRSTSSTDVILLNPTEHSLAESGNGSIDFGVPTVDIVRAVRSGGNQAVTGDPYNGYLPDNSAPRIVGSLDLQINFPPQQSTIDPNVFNLPQITFVSAFCSQAPQRGDLISQPGLFAEVLADAAIQASGIANNVAVRLVVIPASWGGDPGQFVSNGAAPAQYLVPFDINEDAARAACFVEFTPAGAGGPDAPGTLLLPNATYTLRFNEPIDPASLAAFDTFAITRRMVPQEPIDYVPGGVQRSVDLQEFTFTPELALAHVQGSTETYYVLIDNTTFAPSDLAGNAIDSTLPPVPLTLAPGSPSQPTGGRVIRFTGPDEESPRIGEVIGGVPIEEIRPEWNGQHVYDLGRQLIRPRPVTRSQLFGDRNNTLPGAMFQQPAGQNLPLNTFGAKTQILYRYVDFELPFKVDNRIDAGLDATHLNIDIEGVSLSPQSGGVIFESYARFRMTMGHAGFLPDEALDPFGNIALPATGITDVFENNYLNVVEDPPTVVHADFNGYQIIPGDLFQSAGGTNFIPLPQNRGLQPAQKRYYTWRDTLVRTRGGPNGIGIYPGRWLQLFPGAAQEIFPGPDMMGNLTDCNLPAAGTACLNPFNSAGNIQTSGLPLLIEFDCFPSAGAQTQNLFDTSMLHPTQTVPYSRAFSAGGFDPQGNQVFVDPDLEITANGGFNPAGTPPGTGTPPRDNTYYIGALDLVIRVSRTASLFYPAINPLLSDGNPQTNTDPRFTNPIYFPAVIAPSPEDQPTGTSVVVRYRGASIIPDDHRSRNDARELDPYGDFYPDFREQMLNVCDGSFSHDPNRCDGTPLQNEGITFFNGTEWRRNASELNGAQFIQVHLTFTNNVDSGLSPSVSSVALSWSE